MPLQVLEHGGFGGVVLGFVVVVLVDVVDVDVEVLEVDVVFGTVVVLVLVVFVDVLCGVILDEVELVDVGVSNLLFFDEPTDWLLPV